MSPRLSQTQRILRLLQEYKGEWCPLYAILHLDISQYGARIRELRLAGYQIENRSERQPDGSRHSWFRLVPKENS